MSDYVPLSQNWAMVLGSLQVKCKVIKMSKPSALDPYLLTSSACYAYTLQQLHWMTSSKLPTLGTLF